MRSPPATRRFASQARPSTRHAPRVDPRLQPAARMLGEHARERLVEPQARAFGRHAMRGGRRFGRVSGASHALVAGIGMRRPSAIIRGIHEGCR